MKQLCWGILLCSGLWGQQATPPKPLAAEDSVVMVKGMGTSSLHQGSGVVVAPGVVATNAHVVSGAVTAVVAKGKDFWVVREFCVEPDRDLCLLTVPGLTVPPAQVGTPEDARPGRPVHSIGYPGGVLQIRAGNLVATWSFLGSHLIQANAPIAPGSSGGGLFTDDGRLLGITTFIYGGNGRLNFSIPIDWIGRLQVDGSLRAKLICPGVARENVTQEFLEHIADDPVNWDSWYALSQFWVQDSPEDPNAWYARGIALSLRLHQQTEQPGVEVDPRLLEESLAAYQRAVKLGPRLSKVWNNLGAALDRLGRFEDARKAFQQAIELKPEDPLPWLNLGSTLLSDRKCQRALAPFRKGLSLQGDNAVAWSRLAYCEGVVGHWTEATRCYRIALRLCPMRSTWWGDLYQACLRGNDPGGAASALERLRGLDPDLAQQLEATERGSKKSH